MRQGRARWLRTALLCCTALALTASSAAAGSLQTWDKVFPDGAKRFKVLASFNGEAVLDKETGLVWQRAPSSTSEFDWATSVALCIGTAIGGRRGFRLPSAWELLSLKDPAASNPALTPGHPFEGIVSDVRYWSSTAAAGDAEAALAAGFASGGQGVNTTAKTGTGLRWCVRGPGGDSPGTP